MTSVAWLIRARLWLFKLWHLQASLYFHNICSQLALKAGVSIRKSNANPAFHHVICHIWHEWKEGQYLYYLYLENVINYFGVFWPSSGITSSHMECTWTAVFQVCMPSGSSVWSELRKWMWFAAWCWIFTCNFWTWTKRTTAVYASLWILFHLQLKFL